MSRDEKETKTTASKQTLAKSGKKSKTPPTAQPIVDTVDIVDKIAVEPYYASVRMEHIRVWNNVRKTFDNIEELAESIQGNGLIQAITLMYLSKDTYVLVAGERRYRACKLLEWQQIPAMVHPYDPIRFQRMQILENLQRKQVAPLEEATGISFLLEQGDSIANIALLLGKSASFVHQRIKLTELTEEWKDLLQNGEITLVSALELARLLPPTQEILFKELSTYKKFQTEQIHYAISRQLLELSQAVFDTADESLCGIACMNCLKRSGAQGTLFPEQTTNQDRCLDKSCFEAKEEAFYYRFVAEQKILYPDLLLVSEHWSDTRLLDTPFGEALSYKYWNKAQEEEGVAAVVVERSKVKLKPEIQYVSLEEVTSPTTPTKQDRQQTIRTNKIEIQTRKLAVEAFTRVNFEQRNRVLDYFIKETVWQGGGSKGTMDFLSLTFKNLSIKNANSG